MRVAWRRRDTLHNGFKQRKQILRAVTDLPVRDAFARVSVDHGKIELVFSGVQVDKQVVDFVENFLCARIRAVDLVQHNNGRQLGRQRLLKDVARLWQRPFAGVDQQ